MKNITRKLSAVVLTTVFATMQFASAAIDTGLGAGNGGAVINNAVGGYAGLEKGNNSATLKFNGDSHVNWNTLNVNSNEALNFNAVDGANGLTILNTVNQGMSNIYGQINTNAGIKQLIISNPNGMLYNGAKFTTAADASVKTDVELTTMPMDASFANGNMLLEIGKYSNGVGTITIENSDFSIGGNLNVVSDAIKVAGGKLTVGNDVKFVTANGMDYVAMGVAAPKTAVKLEAVNIDGNVYIVSDKGTVETTTGGTIKGNLNIQSNDSAYINYEENGKILNVSGDVNAVADGQDLFTRNIDVKGNLNMENGGGVLEVGSVHVGKDMNLKTVAKSENPAGYKHFVHVVGQNNDIKGNVTIESKDNIHIGNYYIPEEIQEGCCGTTKVVRWDKAELLPGKLNVGGTLTAHAKDGHVMTTIDVNADKIDFKSDNLNVLSDDKAVLNAKEYKFSSNGYLGALSDYTTESGETITATEQIVSVMENYTRIPNDSKSHAYMNITGGTITQINTPSTSQTFIASKGDVKVTGANAGNVNLTAYRKKIEITGPDVHAKNFNIGNETDYLKLDFEGRDFTTNFTNIRDGKVVTVRPDEVITYELADGGHNQPTLKPTEDRTYLIGPDKEPGPGPQPDPDPNPDPNVPDESSKLLRNWVPDDVTSAPVSTPVAFAADLDDDELDRAVRKNVDGSVTVVRAFPMGK